MKSDKHGPGKSLHLGNISGDGAIDVLFSAAEERKTTILLGTAITLLLLLLSLKFSVVVDRINNHVTSWQIGLIPDQQLSSLPVIVEVDEKSLAIFGQWPWPRYLVARLLADISESGAAAVGIDAVFVERDRTSPIEIRRVLEQDFKQSFSLNGLNPAFMDYDAMLGQTLASGPFILGYFFRYETAGEQNCTPRSSTGVWWSKQGLNQPPFLTPSPPGILCNIAVLQQSANYNGFINASPDDDGLFRKTPLVMWHESRLYPSLALQTYLTANQVDRFVLTGTDRGFNLQAGNMQIPLDQAGNLLVNFPVKDQGFEKISAADILSKTIDQERLKGRIVLIGFSAAGLHEVRPTPYNANFLGVEIHASVLDNLARKAFLQRPGYAAKFEAGLAAILGFVLFATLAGAGPATIVVVHSLVIFLLLAASQFLLARTGMVLSPAIPVLMVLLAFLMLALMKYARENLHARLMDLMIARAQEGIIQSFSSMSEFRDPETGAHIKRTQNYVKALAEHLREQPKFQAQLTDKVIELFYKAAPLHDIGKVGIRDNILLKPSHLGNDEFEIMKSHPQIGADIIEAVAAQSGWNSFMNIAHQICLSHHEKWDGSGYPQGLSGEAIPLSARLMMLADVYDALISKRVYKPPFSHEQARTLIESGKHKQFDPLVVEAFVAIEDRFIEIALEHLDNDNQRATLLNQKPSIEPL